VGERTGLAKLIEKLTLIQIIEEVANVIKIEKHIIDFSTVFGQSRWRLGERTGLAKIIEQFTFKQNNIIVEK
jgi:hypothetical protein